jgi:hypothetical protein
MSKRYRGRRDRRGKAVKTICVLFILITAFGLAVYTLLPNYLIHSADEVRFRLGFIDVLISPSSPQPTYSIQSTPVLMITGADPENDISEPIIPVQLGAVRALLVPEAAYHDEVLLASVMNQVDGSANALVIDWKPDSGLLPYVSSLPEAITAGAVSAAPEALAVLRAIQERNIYVIARISCFHDHTVASRYTDKRLSVQTQGNIQWIDRNNTGWLNPYIPQARDYITGVVLEAAEAQFDEIWLDNVCFPFEGRPELIHYGSQNTPRHTVIESFVSNIRNKLDERDIWLSLIPSVTCMVHGLHEEAGQRLLALSAYTDRFIIKVPARQPSESLQGAVTQVQMIWPEDYTFRILPQIDITGDTRSQLSDLEVGGGSGFYLRKPDGFFGLGIWAE